MNLLSSSNRPQIIRKLKGEEYNLLVIGGGITGAGIALDAISRGMKVALVEKNDFASGTSSKSTKLIHGGLRYLKQLEIGLVREVGRERAIVHRLAPHLVKAEKMLLPIEKGGTFGKWGTSIGLWVYDFLANVKGDDRRRMLTRKQAMEEEPLLRTTGLLGGGLYAEYRTDDARLTIEIIKTAVRQGAVCLNYAGMMEFIYQNGQVAGVKCVDTQLFDIKAKYVVSAAGPWVDDLRKKDNSLKGKHLFLSKGVHIVVAHKRLPLRHSVYFDVDDGRMIFAIPRNRTTYIGTTDTPFKGDLNHVFAEKEDVDYLLKAANDMFPSVRLTVEDVESSWAGLRPLIYEEGKSASEMSRKDEIFQSESGLISIAGGKLTGYRQMAKRIVDLVSRKFWLEHQEKFGPCLSDKIPLTERPLTGPAEIAGFQAGIAQKLDTLNLPSHFASYLVENYGMAAGGILDDALISGKKGEMALVQSELNYCLENELVFSSLDFFERRTGRLYFQTSSILPALDAVSTHLASYFGRDEAAMKQDAEQVKEAIKKVSAF